MSLRVVLAWFLLSGIVFCLLLVGAAQSFLDSTLKNLFVEVRWLCWGGGLGTWLFLVPFSWVQRNKRLASVTLGLGFTILFSLVLYWGAWIYPEAGNGPW